MKHSHTLALLSAALCAGLVSVGAGNVLGQANEDNLGQGGGNFPLAAKAGVDSHAIDQGPPGAVNTGKFDDTKWKYGTAWNPADGPAPIWNPVKWKLMHGGKVTGGTLFSATDTETYCAMANAGYDFVWTEMQHNSRDWSSAAKMWSGCGHAKAVPGVRIAFTNEREEQHALDAGALVLVVPTVRSYEEAIEARNWAYFPPLGKRSNGGGQAFTMYANVPGGYRQTVNDNLVLVLMIETLDGLRDAARIAKIPGVTAIFAASGDLGNFSGYKQGDPDYERAINIVHDAAINAHVGLCGPIAWRDRPDFNCFQGATEITAITRGVAQELGSLTDTQGKPNVGPWSAAGSVAAPVVPQTSSPQPVIAPAR